MNFDLNSNNYSDDYLDFNLDKSMNISKNSK